MQVQKTENGTPYLTKPHVILIGMTSHLIDEDVETFINDMGFDGTAYVEDANLISSDDGTILCKFAGQLCYASFGEKRTKTSDAPRYFKNIAEQQHFSVMEHSVYSFLLYGVSRSLTHELIRHRHFSYSQISQRYVDQVRYVMRPEFSQGPLRSYFLARIDKTQAQYDALVELMLEQVNPDTDTQSKTEARKAVRQAARACLTNEVEAPIVVTGNARSWREFLAKRGNKHAEPEIRALAVELCSVLKEQDPCLFQDFETDGSEVWQE